MINIRLETSDALRLFTDTIVYIFRTIYHALIEKLWFFFGHNRFLIR